MDKDKLIIVCKCGKEMLPGEQHWNKYKNFRITRYYCANCGNEITLRLHRKVDEWEEFVESVGWIRS